MARVPSFASPFMLGFDELESMLETISKSGGEGFPPYNIEQLDAQTLRISLALAGYQLTDLDVELHNNQLMIKGGGADPQSDTRQFLHRGIAARQFVRKFVLADGMEVKDAFMELGLLHIDLVRPKPEDRRRTIAIRAPAKGS